MMAAGPEPYFPRRNTELQSPWFRPENKLTPSQRISIANLHDYFHGSDTHMDDGDVDEMNPKGYSDSSRFRFLSPRVNQDRPSEKPTTTARAEALPSLSSVLQLFTACAGQLQQVQEALNQSYRKAMPARCANQDPDDLENDSIQESLRDTFDEEEMWVRRLGSWNTLGTVGTVGTIGTVGTAGTQDNSLLFLYDDEGHRVGPKTDKIAWGSGSETPSRRRRLVRFEYPPVSAMKTCPRAAVADLPSLFFTEEELESYEADREATRRTDDIEIVAISHSLSDPHDPSAAAQVHVADGTAAAAEVGSPRPEGFRSHLPTPRNGHWARTRSALNALDGLPRHRPLGELPPLQRRLSWGRGAAKPAPTPSASENPASPRLVKSVQIFLRDRSTTGR